MCWAWPGREEVIREGAGRAGTHLRSWEPTGVWTVPDTEARREDLISRITDLEALSQNIGLNLLARASDHRTVSVLGRLPEAWKHGHVERAEMARLPWGTAEGGMKKPGQVLQEEPWPLLPSRMGAASLLQNH